MPKPPPPATMIAVRRQELVELIAAGHSPDDAAAILGVSIRTIRRYLAGPEAAAELRALHRDRLTALLRTSLTAAPDALTTLRRVAADAMASEHARVAAARAILDHALRLYEAADLDERLAQVERRLDADAITDLPGNAGNGNAHAADDPDTDDPDQERADGDD